MKHFLNSLLVSFVALSLLSACGKNGTEDVQGQNDALIQPEEVEAEASAIAAEVAEEEPSPSFLTSTNQNGQVYGAFADQRIMSEEAAIQLVESGQLEWLPIETIANSGDQEFLLEYFDPSAEGELEMETAGVHSGGHKHHKKNRRRKAGKLTHQLQIDVSVSGPISPRQIRKAYKKHIRRARRRSRWYTTYVSVPLPPPVVIEISVEYFIHPAFYQTVSTCSQNYGAFAYQNRCGRPYSVSADVYWSLQVTCKVPTRGIPLRGGYDPRGTVVYVFQ